MFNKRRKKGIFALISVAVLRTAELENLPSRAGLIGLDGSQGSSSSRAGKGQIKIQIRVKIQIGVKIQI